MSWPKQATLKLLELVSTNYSAFNDKLTKNRCIWRDIASLLSDVMPGVNGLKCDQKWRNLKKAHKKYVDNQNKTGRGRLDKPEFFDEVDAIVGDSHAVRPPFTLDTAASSASSDDISSLATIAEAAQLTPSTSEIHSHQKPAVADETKTKKLRPKATREKLDEKLDMLIAAQTAHRENSNQQMNAMMEMFSKQHQDRMEQMDRFISVLRGGKGCKRKRTTTQKQEPNDSDSN